jgi:hypothetical protein
MKFLVAFLLLPVFVNAQDNCVDQFFTRGKKVPAPSKVMLKERNGKVINLADFLNSHSTSSLGFEAQYGVFDLDKDKKKEIIIYSYTGGAHCCDEFYFFSNSGLNNYSFTAKTYAGNVCVTDSNEFVYSFHEQFGYFFTCFACAYEDSSDAAPIDVSSIRLRYVKGRLQLVPPDKELNAQVNDNLGKLGEQPYEKLEDETAQDNGLRKAFAMNLAVYYFSYGKNLAATQKIFHKYYKYPDAKKVWTAFAKQLAYMSRENLF